MWRGCRIVGHRRRCLLRESYREGGKVKNRTLANLSRWPDDKVNALARLLKGLPAQVELVRDGWDPRSLPHGHVAGGVGYGTPTGDGGL